MIGITDEKKLSGREVAEAAGSEVLVFWVRWVIGKAYLFFIAFGLILVAGIVIQRASDPVAGRRASSFAGRFRNGSFPWRPSGARKSSMRRKPGRS